MKALYIVVVVATLTGCPKNEPECEKYDNGLCKAAMLPDADDK
jgi:hypothetical protein